MKSDICNLTKDAESLAAVLTQTEKAAKYGNLDKKQTSRLRLLAEELIGMLPELLSFSGGQFWVESNGNEYELHTSLTPTDKMTIDKRDKLMAISTTGKNVAAVGIMNKIRLAVSFMMTDIDQAMAESAYLCDFYNGGMTKVPIFPDSAWSLRTYKEQAEAEKGQPWDELEKSIIANIADDVLVGLQGKRVDIIVKKSF